MAAFGTTMREEQFSTSAKIWIDSPARSNTGLTWCDYSNNKLQQYQEISRQDKIHAWEFYITWGVTLPFNFGT